MFAAAVLLCSCFESSSRPSPVHLAAANGDVATVRSWIAGGGNVDLPFDESDTLESPREKGITPLMLAAERGRLDVLDVLVKAGANLYLESHIPRRDVNRNAFEYAVRNGQLGAAEYLWGVSDHETYRKRAEINLRQALTRMCSQGTRAEGRDLAMLLIDNVTTRDVASRNLWLISGQRECMDDVRFLMNSGVGFTPAAVAVAAEHGLTDLVGLYLQRGADINARAEVTTIPPAKTPLIAAAAAAQLHTVRYLLAQGAEPNALDSFNRNALIAAIDGGECLPTMDPCPRHEVVKLLVRHGARSDIRDATNRTLGDYVAMHRYDADRLRAILAKQ